MSEANLLEKYKQLQVELESANQALYDCRRQAKTTQSLEVEYQEEIKLVQSQAVEQEQILKARIQQLEDENQNTRTINNERVSDLEKELLDKEQEIADLKKNLEDFVKISQVQTVHDKTLDEITKLHDENAEFQERLLELEKVLKDRQQQNLVQVERIKQLEAELADHAEILKCKRDELEEAKTLNQNLRDELTCAQSELDSVKSCPLDQGSKGNSLFAEVDDRRVQLQQNINTMKSKYIDMKRDRASLLKQISSLRHENSTLIAQLNGELNDRKYDEERIVDSYKFQIETLNELIDSYKKELSGQPNSDEISAQGLKFFENMLATKNAEIETWRQKFSARSINYTSLSYELAEANRKIRQLTLENLHVKHEVEELKLKIKEIEVSSPVEQAPPEHTVCEKCSKPTIKSIVKNTEQSNIEENKENDGTKRVQFSENTIDSHVTDRNKFRRGKPTISKSVVFP
ncbi:protein Spindly [Zophobas morio]|uniref:protein Spindly n=1 Tax=Zophobas morio TaxID=2755281 RepID=UPI00308280F4